MNLNEWKNAVFIILGCSIPIFWSGVITFAYPGVMSSYWQETFHVGNTETGFVVTCMLIGLALTMFFSGRVHAKHGMGVCVLICILVYVVSFAILFCSKNIYMLYIFGFIENIGCSFSLGPGLTTAQKSYPEHKGFVSGIINLSFGIAAGIMSPVLHALFESKGYNYTNIVVIIAIVVSDIISYILIKLAKPTAAAIKHEQEEAANPHDLTVSQTLKTRDFWLIWVVWAFMGASGISMVSLSKTYSLKIGQTGVLLHTVYNLANGIFRIFIGIMIDHIGARITGAIGYACTALGYIILLFTENIFVVCLCTGGIGIGFGTIFTVTGPLASDLFGLKYFGMIYGIIFTAYGIIGGIVGPLLSGIILEKTNNNFNIVFTYLGVMAIIGTLLHLCVNEKRKEKEILPTKNIEVKAVLPMEKMEEETVSPSPSEV